jgi:hypothetical protein
VIDRKRRTPGDRSTLCLYKQAKFGGELEHRMVEDRGRNVLMSLSLITDMD